MQIISIASTGAPVHSRAVACEDEGRTSPAPTAHGPWKTNSPGARSLKGAGNGPAGFSSPFFPWRGERKS